MLRGNAVIIEWLCSPIVYRGNAWFRDGLLDLARRASTRDAVGRHYLHLGERQRRVYLTDPASVPLKKIFYALRPAAAARWLRQRPEESVAPMHFPTLMAECDPPRDVRDIVAELMVRKAVSRELGEAPLPPPIAAFVDTEFALAGTAFRSGRAQPDDDKAAEAGRFYRSTVERLDREASSPSSVAG